MDWQATILIGYVSLVGCVLHISQQDDGHQNRSYFRTGRGLVDLDELLGKGYYKLGVSKSSWTGHRSSRTLTIPLSTRFMECKWRRG